MWFWAAFACDVFVLTSLLEVMVCGRGLLELLDVVGDALRDVVVDEGVDLVEGGLEGY